MGKPRRTSPLWHVPDRLWASISDILEHYEPQKRRGTRGRPGVDRRRILDGIIFQLRTGCPWNRIPPAYGNDATIHRYFRMWSDAGILERIWRVLVAESPELAKFWTPLGDTAPEREGPG